MTDLATALADLVRHHVATPAQPLLEPAPPISWIWAANGIFKRGTNQHLDAMIRVGDAPEVPGLVNLLPHVRWRGVRGRIPGQLLPHILSHARLFYAGRIEQQYFVIFDGGKFRVRLPPQQNTATRINYRMVQQGGTMLLDIHSHHGMPAYFSETDDRDDVGLSVSAVLGSIHTTPRIVCRVNVHGHRQRVPALTLFDSLPPGLEDKYADTHD